MTMPTEPTPDTAPTPASAEPCPCACAAPAPTEPSSPTAPTAPAARAHARAPKRILLGVTGSIAAFKACHLASDWTKAGAQVRVILTRGGARFVTPLTFEALTHLKPRMDVFPDGGEPVDAFGEGRSGIAHIEDATWADLFVVAPASADAIARLAAGMADDELTATFLAATCPKLVVPAMNAHMFANPATQRNIATLRGYGVRVLDPSEGELACGVTGRGRMPEPADIEAVVARMLGCGGTGASVDAPVLAVQAGTRASAVRIPDDGVSDDGIPDDGIPDDGARGVGADMTDGIHDGGIADDGVDALDGSHDGGAGTHADGACMMAAGVGAASAPMDPSASDAHMLPLAGTHVLVTAGPTREPLDPVRFLSNRSTGKMGYAVAEAARDMGAEVTLVSGPTALADPEGVSTIRVESAWDMFDAVRAHADANDMFVMAAAVGDFRATEVAPEKIKKNGRDHIVMEFAANPDILAWLGAHKRADQAVCGFAMETTDLVANAGRKLTGKHADMLVANNLRTPGAGFATDTNIVTVLTLQDGGGDAHGRDAGEPAVHAEQLPKMGKRELGGLILERLAAIRERAAHQVAGSPSVGCADSSPDRGSGGPSARCRSLRTTKDEAAAVVRPTGGAGDGGPSARCRSLRTTEDEAAPVFGTTEDEAAPVFGTTGGVGDGGPSAALRTTEGEAAPSPSLGTLAEDTPATADIPAVASADVNHRDGKEA